MWACQQKKSQRRWEWSLYKNSSPFHDSVIFVVMNTSKSLCIKRSSFSLSFTHYPIYVIIVTRSLRVVRRARPVNRSWISNTNFRNLVSVSGFSRVYLWGAFQWRNLWYWCQSKRWNCRRRYESCQRGSVVGKSSSSKIPLKRSSLSTALSSPGPCSFFVLLLPRRKIGHFIVVCWVTWPMNASEARSGLALIQTSLPFSFKCQLRLA